MKIKLFDYQIEDRDWGIANPYSILALQMGLGKTGISLSISEETKSQRVLCIVPAYLTLNWKNEINKFLDNKIITLFKSSKDVYYQVDSDFVVVSYDIAIKSECLFEWADMVICDEAQNIKSMKARRTQMIHKLVFESSVPRFHLLTGTPVKNRVEEYYSLISLCYYNPKNKEDKFASTFETAIDFADYFSFRKEIEKFIRNRRIKIVSWEGVREDKIPELKKWLAPIYRSRKSMMLPPIIKNVIVSDAEDVELWKEYLKLEESDSVSVMPTQKKSAAVAKVPFTIEYVKDLLEEIGDSPVVIFTDHVESCKLIAEYFQVPAITGEMSVNNRQTLADEFQTGRWKILVATIGSFSTGYTLTKAWNMVFNDYNWTPGDNEQAIFRINRIGQTETCIIHNILGSPQDQYIWETLQSKKEVIKKVT